jgi:cobalt-precorrin-5B (C1)-methyltransferase
MKRLRSGYTTGACAAAAAKGAALLVLSGTSVQQVEIPFPGGARVVFPLVRCGWEGQQQQIGVCSVIKDAGDDPDVTNGAEIVAKVQIADISGRNSKKFIILGGAGVGRVTKPGLSVPVGSPAINPVPLKMIEQAVDEALVLYGKSRSRIAVTVTISIPKGEELARLTLNKRLGIIGGLSVLGTTGVVVPISAAAWTATITSSMNVARETGVQEIVLSTGRTSEKAAEKYLGLAEEAYVMMGDYLEYSLQEASHHNFKKIHIAGMWAKILKGAMKIPQTHVRHGALEIENAVDFLCRLTGRSLDYLRGANTAREIYERLVLHQAKEAISAVCLAAKDYYQSVAGGTVEVHLVHASGAIIESV